MILPLPLTQEVKIAWCKAWMLVLDGEIMCYCVMIWITSRDYMLLKSSKREDFHFWDYYKSSRQTCVNCRIRTTSLVDASLCNHSNIWTLDTIAGLPHPWKNPWNPWISWRSLKSPWISVRMLEDPWKVLEFWKWSLKSLNSPSVWYITRQFFKSAPLCSISAQIFPSFNVLENHDLMLEISMNYPWILA